MDTKPGISGRLYSLLRAKLAFRLAHRGYVLQTGSIVQEGSTKELSEGDLVAKAYLGK